MSAALLDYSERAMRSLIRTIPAGSYTWTDFLDDDGYGHLDLPFGSFVFCLQWISVC